MTQVGCPGSLEGCESLGRYTRHLVVGLDSLGAWRLQYEQPVTFGGLARLVVDRDEAGVVTTDLVPLAASQRAFPGLGQLDREHGAALMAAMDACNRRFGRGAVVPGTAGFAPKREWSSKFEMRSPSYTTRVEELPIVPAA